MKRPRWEKMENFTKNNQHIATGSMEVFAIHFSLTIYICIYIYIYI